MSMTSIIHKYNDGVSTIVLESQDGKPPTLDDGTLKELETCISEIRDRNPDIVFVRSSSEKYFCVGANIQALKTLNESTIGSWVLRGNQVFSQLEDLAMPVVAVVKGYAMGGGLELALACDLIYADHTAQFAQSEAKLGFIPGWGGTRRLPGRIGTAKAKYLFYSGRLVDASTAEKIGLVDFISTSDDFEAALVQLTGEIQANSRNALTWYKSQINGLEKALRDQNAAAEAFGSESCLQDAETLARIRKFLEGKGI